MSARCPWCNRPAHADDCHAKLLARRLLDEIGPAGRPVTSPARGGPDTAGMREALAEAIAGWWVGEPGHEITEDEAVELSEYLLPVVQRLAVEKAAEALEEARQHACCDADEHRLRVRRDRALALAAAAQPTDGRTT